MVFGPYLSILYGFVFVSLSVFLDFDIEGFELFSAYIQYVPGGMCQNSGECSLC